MEMNFKAPTKIQYDFFKSYGYSDHKFMAGETGSGKTLAYGATILSNLLFKRKDSSNEKALILTPGGHLNTQTVEKLRQLAENTSLKVAGMDKKEGVSE
jgi:superfamily II DNA/RNA helicase